MNMLIAMKTLLILCSSLVKNASVRYLRRKSHNFFTVSNVLDPFPNVNQPCTQKKKKKKDSVEAKNLKLSESYCLQIHQWVIKKNTSDQEMVM